MCTPNYHAVELCDNQAVVCGGRLWPVVGGCGPWWETVVRGRKLWSVVGGRGPWWEAVACGGKLWPVVGGCGPWWEAGPVLLDKLLDLKSKGGFPICCSH